MKGTTNRHTTKRFLWSKPVLWGVLVFILFSVAGMFILKQRYQILQEAEQREMARVINLVENNLNQTLNNSYSVALSLALLIDGQGEVQNFEEVAARLVKENPVIDAVQMVPQGVITMVYPLEQHKKALDYNILNDEIHRVDALKAVESGRMFFAGPLKLRQGGIAVVGRLPVYFKNSFWGFSAVLIHLETLLHHSGIDQLAADKYQFQFSKNDPLTGEEVFYLPQILLQDTTYSQVISLADSDWKFYIVPLRKSGPAYAMLPVGVLLILLAGSLGWLMTHFLRQPEKLRALVALQAGEISHNELKFRTIFDQAAIGIAMVDSLSGKLLETNSRFQELLGYSDEELEAFDYEKVALPAAVEEDNARLEQLQKGEIREYSLEKEIRTRDKGVRWVKLTVSPMWEEGDTPGTHITLVQDINARKTAEKSLKNSYDIVMEQNRRLLNFSYIVSHNLRSHSSNIESILSLYEDAASRDEKENYMSLLQKVSAALSQTLLDLNEVVSVHNNKHLHTAPLPVQDYINQTLDLLKVDIEKKQATVDINLGSGMKVDFNAAYLESVLLNLLTNALNYSHTGRLPLIEITGRREAQHWVLIVKDNGIGIDMDKNREKLFGLYKTFSSNKQARGVGLFITRNQVEAMGGSIEVESTPGEGSTFKVIFK